MTNEAPLSDVSETVGRRVRDAREQHRWSVEHLAEQCAAAGAPQLTVNALYALESGRKEKATGRRRRQITVDELLALAYVLRVHPVDLLVPSDLGADDPYDVAPAVTTTAGAARGWIGGQGFLTEPDSPAELAEAIRYMPTERAREVASAWLRPREAALIRATNAAEQSEGEESGG